MKYLNAKGQRLQDSIIAAMLAQKSVSEIAKTVGATENSIRNWAASPEFQEKYQTARQATFGKAMDAVQSRLEAGVEAIWALVLDPEASATARVAGFRVLMDAAWRAKDLTDLEQRISELEGKRVA